MYLYIYTVTMTIFNLVTISLLIVTSLILLFDLLKVAPLYFSRAF